MDRCRVVEVLSEQSRGSGYLVADRLVLTAAHVLRSGEVFTAEPRVQALDGERPVRARTRWIRYDGPEEGVDAALLEIVDPRWVPPSAPVPVVWARIADVEPGHRVQVGGFPDAMAGRRRDVDQVLATVNPLSGARSGRLQLTVASAPIRTRDGRSGWAGISGGPVCTVARDGAPSALLAVVVVDPLRYSDRLAAVPVDAVLADAAVAEILRRHGLADINVSSYSGTDHSSAIRSTLAAAMRTLPRDLSAFVGRDRELARLSNAVIGASGAGRVIDIHAIGGMPGVGKTALAVHLGHRLADRFPDGQLFLPLHGHTPGQSPVDPADGLVALLSASGVSPELIPGGPDRQSTIDARAVLWRDRMASKRVLLVLDDAVDHRQVEPLLPNAAESLVLITSRRRLAALPDTVVLSLDILDESTAVEMLCGRSGRTAEGAEAAAAAAVVEHCGRLPLAVGLVAGRLRNHPSWSFAHLAADLGRARRRLSRLRAGNVAVAAAFELSYRELPEDRQTLFRRLSLNPGTECDAEIAAALHGSDPDDAADELEYLYDDHMLIESAPGRYRMHDLVREYAGLLTDEDDPADRDAARERLFAFLEERAVAAGAAIAPGAAPGGADAVREAQAARDWLDTEIANLLACARYCADHGHPERVVVLARALSGFLRFVGPWDQAVALHSAAAECARQSAQPTLQIEALTNLALVRRLGGDYRGAADELRAATAVAQVVGDRRLEARVLNDLGAVHGQTGDYPATIAAHDEAVPIFRENGDRAGEASALNYLGVAHRLVGRYDEATAELARSAELFHDLGDRRGEAVALANLGIVHRQTGRYDSGTRLVEQALALSRGIRDRRGSTYIIHALGVLRSLTGRADEALDLQNEALQIARELGDRRGQVYSLNYLGAVHRSMGNPAAAARAHQEALDLARELGDRRAQSHALRHLSAAHRLQGELFPAGTAAEGSLLIAEELGDRRGQGNTLRTRAEVRLASGERELAARDLDDALDLARAIGDRHGEAQTLNARGGLRRPSHPASALADHESALALARELGNPRQTGAALLGAGRCERDLGRVDAAERRLREALAVYESLGAREAPSVAAELAGLRA
ncbi:tetratricopeptide repeat protein [Kitasatospora sp. NPDC091257]|uniref:tetratricopeptide repeat protein n=1 Tax=Kitasatospora sp. NPDC091257 TaxID=3364084 RepID=UPI0037F6EAE9